MTSALDQLPDKARRLAEEHLVEGEDVVTVIPGRSKQAMIVTGRRILIVKSGFLAGAWLSPKLASFPLETITTINAHAGRGVVALELVVDGLPIKAKADLRAAYQLPNWLACQASVASPSLIRELRAYAQSDGRSRSARAELSGFDTG